MNRLFVQQASQSSFCRRARSDIWLAAPPVSANACGMEISMNDKIYKVIDIEEPDFGCEGLPDGEQIMDIVTLQESEGVTDIRLKISDAYLYQEEIDVGTEVIIKEDTIIKII